MLLKYLHLKGFTSYMDSEIQFDDNPFIATIIAPNGSGKSSILEAITTALFYRARGVDNRGAGMDDLINNECNYFEITLEFIIDNNIYKIIRRKFKGGKHELEFYINNNSQTEKINDTQEKINNVIKMNYETFLDTVCIGQGMSGNFMKKKPNERKDVFVEILNLNQFEVLEKYTRELKKELVNELDSKNNKLNILQENLINEDNYKATINKNNVRLSALKNEIITLQFNLDKVKKEKIEYETLKKQNEQMIIHKNNISNSIKNTNSKINGLKDKFLKIKEDLKELNSNLINQEEMLSTIIIGNVNIENSNKEKINKLIEELLEQKQKLIFQKNDNIYIINMYGKNVILLQNQYDNLDKYDKGVCDFCGNEITKEHKEKHLLELKNEIDNYNNSIQKLNEEIEIINSDINKVQNTYDEYKKELQKIEKHIEDINKEILKKERLNSSIELLKEKISLYKDNISSIKDEKKSLEEELNNLNIQYKEYENVKELEQKTFNDNELEKELLILMNEEQNINNTNIIFENKLQEIKENRNKFLLLEKEIKDLEVQIKDHESLIEAFGKKGIQANIIANVLPDIENEINNVLEVLFNNSTTIEFITQKESKSKAKSDVSLETLDIIIHDKDKDRTYETYSGGEKFRIDFAFHIGLSKFLAKRAKANIEFFMIDEGLGSQDEEGKENFILTINKLSNMFKQIFIITHIEELKDAFDKKIIINKDPINGSKIEVV